MTPRSLTLAALASAAVPGVAPVSATEVSSPHRLGPQRFYTAVVTDSRAARWVVRLPADAVAAARQDAVLPFLSLLGPRLPFQVPAPAGRAAVRDGRGAVIYPHLAGAPLSLAKLPPGSQLAAGVGRALAAIHNLDRRMVDEATLPSYDAENCRRRHLAELDRAAETRRVPTGLLSRWEGLLDDVSLWRFAPTVVHGRLDGAQILVQAADRDDIETAKVTGVVGWEEAGVADPATDFAQVVRRCSTQTADTVFEAYAMARNEPADPKLLERAALIAELDVVAAFVAAVLAQDEPAMAQLDAELTDLDARVGDRDTPGEDAEPPLESAALDSWPDPVDGSSLYQAGQMDAEEGTEASRSTDSKPSVDPPVDTHQQRLAKLDADRSSD